MNPLPWPRVSYGNARDTLETDYPKRHVKWPLWVFFAFFLVDSFNWDDLFFGLDFRGSYFILSLGIALAIGANWLVVSRSHLRIFLFLLLMAMPSIAQDLVFLRGTLLQIVGCLPFAYLSYILITRGFGSLSEAKNAYVKACIFASAAVILEQLIFILGGVSLLEKTFGFLTFKNFNDYVQGSIYRASGIFYEPSQVGLLLPPGLYLSIISRRRFAASAVALAMLFSFSTLALAAAAVVLGFVLRSARATWIAVALAVSATTLILEDYSIFSDRLVPLFSTLLERDKHLSAQQLNDMKGTAGTLVANAYITVESLKISPILGHGFGNFRNVYDGYLQNVLVGDGEVVVLHNKGGASLLLRILSELGILGTGIIFYFYSRRFLSLKRKSNRFEHFQERYSLAVCATIFFVTCLFRKDMVVSFYFWFFLTLFIIVTNKTSTSVLQSGRFHSASGLS